jgi:hypothetical protein
LQGMDEQGRDWFEGMSPLISLNNCSYNRMDNGCSCVFSLLLEHTLMIWKEVEC